MSLLKYWVKPALFAMVALSLLLGAFNNCQNSQGNPNSFATGVAISEEVCTQQIQYFFNPQTQISMYAGDGCEARLLKSKGFVEVSASFAAAINIDGEDLMWVELKVPSTDEACTANFEIMLHEDLGLCAEARNGCEINYAEFLGFTSDYASACPPKN